MLKTIAIILALMPDASLAHDRITVSTATVCEPQMLEWNMAGGFVEFSLRQPVTAVYVDNVHVHSYHGGAGTVFRIRPWSGYRYLSVGDSCGFYLEMPRHAVVHVHPNPHSVSRLSLAHNKVHHHRRIHQEPERRHGQRVRHVHHHHRPTRATTVVRTRY